MEVLLTSVISLGRLKVFKHPLLGNKHPASSNLGKQSGTVSMSLARLLAVGTLNIWTRGLPGEYLPQKTCSCGLRATHTGRSTAGEKSLLCSSWDYRIWVCLSWLQTLAKISTSTLDKLSNPITEGPTNPQDKEKTSAVLGDLSRVNPALGTSEPA